MSIKISMSSVCDFCKKIERSVQDILAPTESKTEYDIVELPIGTHGDRTIEARQYKKLEVDPKLQELVDLIVVILALLGSVVHEDIRKMATSVLRPSYIWKCSWESDDEYDCDDPCRFCHPEHDYKPRPKDFFKSNLEKFARLSCGDDRSWGRKELHSIMVRISPLCTSRNCAKDPHTTWLHPPGLCLSRHCSAKSGPHRHNKETGNVEHIEINPVHVASSDFVSALMGYRVKSKSPIIDLVTRLGKAGRAELVREKIAREKMDFVFVESNERDQIWREEKESFEAFWGLLEEAWKTQPDHKTIKSPVLLDLEIKATMNKIYKLDPHYGKTARKKQLQLHEFAAVATVSPEIKVLERYVATCKWYLSQLQK